MIQLVTTFLILFLTGCGSSLTPITEVPAKTQTTEKPATPVTPQVVVPAIVPALPTPNSFVQATLDIGQMISSMTTGTQLKYENVIANRNKDYDPFTGVFTPKKAGFYFVNAQIGMPVPATGWDSGHYCQMWIVKSDGSFSANEISSMKKGDTIPCIVSISSTVALLEGQSISFGALAVPSSTSIALSKNPYSSMSITWLGD